MVNQDLIKFIKEARRRGFDDYQIREPLIKNNWPVSEVDSAFASLSSSSNQIAKNKIELYLNPEVIKLIQKRANKNMFSISEQIEDILRRSCVNSKKIKNQEEKLDDMFITLFSRKGRKR
ncbi:MAG: hypothetical protein WC781_01500 [Candidatus Pacearchaeota archaeon]|jgi:hypothetical protein